MSSVSADSGSITADSQLTADGRPALVATPGYIVRARRRVFRVAL